jgi:hypothetical protein
MFGMFFNTIKSAVAGFTSWLSSKAMSLLLGFSACLGLFFSGFVCYAQDAQSVEVAAPDIDWTSLPGDIMTALAQPIAVGIGIAISIFVVYMAVKLVKRI